MVRTDGSDGGQAFPTYSTLSPLQGMSLRDWFAGQAIAGLASHYEPPELAAEIAFKVADAMLAARMK